MADGVNVTQADRDAAARHTRAEGRIFSERMAFLMERGEHDGELVQAFARHRIAAMEECAVWMEEQWEEGWANFIRDRRDNPEKWV